MRARERDLDRAEELVEELRLRQMTELERIAGMSRDEARELLMSQVREEMRHDLAVMIRQMEEEARARRTAGRGRSSPTRSSAWRRSTSPSSPCRWSSCPGTR